MAKISTAPSVTIPHGAIRSRSYKAGHYPDLLPDWICHDENIKTFLLKVSICCQHLRYLPLPHQHHGKVVSQAIAFVRPGFVKGKAIAKGLSRVRHDYDRRIDEDDIHRFDGGLPKIFPFGREGVEIFRQDCVRRDNASRPY